MKARRVDGIGVHGLQRALAVGAVLAGMPVVVWGLWSGFSYLYLMTGASIAAPFLCLQRPKHFVRACVMVGLVLIGWGCWASSWGCSCSGRRRCFCWVLIHFLWSDRGVSPCSVSEEDLPSEEVESGSAVSVPLDPLNPVY